MNSTTSDDRDWLVPAVLVAIIVAIGLIVAIFLGVRAAGGDDDSVAGQLERWTSCLRAEGANVPLVEPLRDGGFRVTVDGSLVESGINWDALRPALVKCENQAPDGVREITTILGGLSEIPFGGFGSDLFGSGLFGFDPARELPFSTFDEMPGRRNHGRRDLSEICERLAHGELDEADVPPLLRRACG